MSNVPLISTYVRHGEKWFFVSTIDRDSSATASDRRYSETLVWEWDYAKRKTGALLWQGAGWEKSIRVHQACVERIHATGSPEEPEDD